MLRNVDIDDIKMESIRADAEEQLMQEAQERKGRYWSKERRADELYFGEGREQEEDENDENDD